MKIYLVFCFILCSLSSAFSQDLWAVSKVVDGDTFYAFSEGNKKKFRIIGVDTPEFSYFGKPEEPYAKEAKNFLKELIEHKFVLLSYDIQPLDKYGRSLVYVYLQDSTFVNAELMKHGWAITMTIPPNVSHADLFLELQKSARRAKRGIWQD